MRPLIWAGSIYAYNNILFFRHLSILILKVSILKIDTFKVKIDTFKIKIEKCPKNEKNAQVVTRANWIGPIDGLIMRPSRPISVDSNFTY